MRLNDALDKHVCTDNSATLAAAEERIAQLERELRIEKRKGKELARYNDNYIRYTHKAEQERDALKRDIATEREAIADALRRSDLRCKGGCARSNKTGLRPSVCAENEALAAKIAQGEFAPKGDNHAD